MVRSIVSTTASLTAPRLRCRRYPAPRSARPQPRSAGGDVRCGNPRCGRPSRPHRRWPARCARKRSAHATSLAAPARLRAGWQHHDHQYQAEQQRVVDDGLLAEQQLDHAQRHGTENGADQRAGPAHDGPDDHLRRRAQAEHPGVTISVQLANRQPASPAIPALMVKMAVL